MRIWHDNQRSVTYSSDIDAHRNILEFITYNYQPKYRPTVISGSDTMFIQLTLYNVYQTLRTTVARCIWRSFIHQWSQSHPVPCLGDTQTHWCHEINLDLVEEHSRNTSDEFHRLTNNSGGKLYTVGIGRTTWNGWNSPLCVFCIVTRLYIIYISALLMLR